MKGSSTTRKMCVSMRACHMRVRKHTMQLYQQRGHNHETAVSKTGVITWAGAPVIGRRPQASGCCNEYNMQAAKANKSACSSAAAARCKPPHLPAAEPILRRSGALHMPQCDGQQPGHGPPPLDVKIYG